MRIFYMCYVHNVPEYIKKTFLPSNLFHKSFRWMLSQSKPSHTKQNQTLPYFTKPNQNRIFSKTAKKKSDLNETFTKASDGCCLKLILTILSQTKPYHTKPTLNFL